MKIGICGGADVDVTLDPSLCYIGVDKGIETLLDQGIIPIVAVGDFDSLENIERIKDIDVERLPTKKDVTDTHFAIEYARIQGYDEMYLYGVTGGRLDHFMAVLCLLQKYRDIAIYIFDKGNKVQLLKPGKHLLNSDGYTYFSVFSIDKATIDLESCMYSLHQYHLTKDDPLCVSNQTIGTTAVITTSGDLLCIQSKDV